MHDETLEEDIEETDVTLEEPPKEPVEEPGEEAELGVLTFNSVQLPEVVEWEDEGEYTLIVKVRQENKREEEDLTAADFKILEVKSAPVKKERVEEE